MFLPIQPSSGTLKFGGTAQLYPLQQNAKMQHLEILLVPEGKGKGKVIPVPGHGGP
jgi:hypothetical protein